MGIEVPPRASSPSSRVALSSISGERRRNGNMADMASAPDLLSRANRASPPRDWTCPARTRHRDAP